MAATDPPVVTDCSGCGACCESMSYPPFYTRFPQGSTPDDRQDPAWVRLLDERPDLVADVERGYHDREARRRALDDPSLDFDEPCHWYDPASRQCRHYEYRPLVCRDFAVGGADCLALRAEMSIVGRTHGLPTSNGTTRLPHR